MIVNGIHMLSDIVVPFRDHITPTCGFDFEKEHAKLPLVLQETFLHSLKRNGDMRFT